MKTAILKSRYPPNKDLFIQCHDRPADIRIILVCVVAIARAKVDDPLVIRTILRRRTKPAGSKILHNTVGNSILEYAMFPACNTIHIVPGNTCKFAF